MSPRVMGSQQRARRVCRKSQNKTPTRRIDHSLPKAWYNALQKATGSYYEYLAVRLCNPPSGPPDSVALKYDIIGFTEVLNHQAISASGMLEGDANYLFSRTVVYNKVPVVDYIRAWHLRKSRG